MGRVGSLTWRSENPNPFGGERRPRVWGGRCRPPIGKGPSMRMTNDGDPHTNGKVMKETLAVVSITGVGRL